MICLKCKGKVFKRFDDDYHVCLCGKLIELEKVEVVQIKPHRMKYPNSEMHKEIRDYITEHYDEITELRSKGVAWESIRVSLSISWANSTIASHYKEVMEAKGCTPPARRGVFKNPDKVQKFVKQKCYTGRRLK